MKYLLIFSETNNYFRMLSATNLFSTLIVNVNTVISSNTSDHIQFLKSQVIDKYDSIKVHCRCRKEKTKQIFSHRVIFLLSQKLNNSLKMLTKL